MRSKFLSLVGVILLLFVSTGCRLAEVELTYSLNQGTNLKYKVTSDIKTEVIESGAMSMDVHSEVMMTQKVEKVNDAGIMTIRVTYQDGVVKVLDKELPYPLNGKSYVVKMDKRGKILEIGGLEDAQSETLQGISLKRVFQEVQVQFPDKLVRTEDKWTFSKKVEGVGEDSTVMESSFVFDGYKSVKGYDCVRIEGRFSGPSYLSFGEGEPDRQVRGKEKGRITAYFAPDEGKLIKSSARIEIDFATEARSSGRESNTESTRQKIEIDMDTVLVE